MEELRGEEHALEREVRVRPDVELPEDSGDVARSGSEGAREVADGGVDVVEFEGGVEKLLRGALGGGACYAGPDGLLVSETIE